MHPLSFGPDSAFVLCRGRGASRRALNAFDAALVDAGVGRYNLIKVSSILPPRAAEGRTIALPAGAMLPIAYGAETADEFGERISAAVAVAVPRSPANHGVIMEYHARGTASDAERIVREMAAEALALRGSELERIASTAAEAVSGDEPTAVFAGAALVPGAEGEAA